MSEKVIYVGLDVDDQNFHGVALIACTGEALSCHFKRQFDYKICFSLVLES
ncbi:MAG: hypothetical protein J0M15_05615 [Deltaproteobacteria bacterium]|nr:hypothetical protein [Deltaproteobacteria bacterium]